MLVKKLSVVVFLFWHNRKTVVLKAKKMETIPRWWLERRATMVAEP
jgi:hypothetical protein